VRMALVMTADFFSGGLVPLPLLPDWLTKYIDLTPFGSMQNVPFRIYSGNVPLENIFRTIVLQAIWAILLIIVGKVLLSKTLKRVVVQGG